MADVVMDMTIDIPALRALHAPGRCLGAYPCTTIRLLDEVERLRSELAEARRPQEKSWHERLSQPMNAQSDGALR